MYYWNNLLIHYIGADGGFMMHVCKQILWTVVITF